MTVSDPYLALRWDRHRIPASGVQRRQPPIGNPLKAYKPC